jgi:hypothetical protein
MDTAEDILPAQKQHSGPEGPVTSAAEEFWQDVVQIQIGRFKLTKIYHIKYIGQQFGTRRSIAH